MAKARRPRGRRDTAADCARKKRYATSREAISAVEYRRQESGHADLDVYPCMTCKGWHIGHSGRRLPEEE